MKTFEELEEVVHSINEMEEIFKGVVIIACHEKEIQRYTELKDRTFEILVKDVHQNEALCSEPLAECVTCETCRKACKEVLDIINAYSHIPAQFEACKILQQAIDKAEGREE